MAATDDDYLAGQEIGRTPAGSAIDCPFLPGAQPERRNRWLEGFASVRDGVKTQKSEPPPKDQQPRHAG